MHSRHRLSSTAAIREVYAAGKRASSPSAGCVMLVRGTDTPRVAVVAGRKVGGAVARNRAKRRLRAALTPRMSELAPGTHAVVGATSRTATAPFEVLERDLARIIATASARVTAERVNG